jgi:hypothetical protein
MNSNNNDRYGAPDPSGEISQLLAGLEQQKEELGPIADELLALFHGMGVNSAPETRNVDLNPSNG